MTSGSTWDDVGLALGQIWDDFGILLL